MPHPFVECLTVELVGDDIVAMIEMLANGVRSIPRLKGLCCRYNSSPAVTCAKAINDAMASLVLYAARYCPQLYLLSIQIAGQSMTLDTALAECIRTGRNLTFVELYNRNRDASAGKSSLPLTMDAFHGKFTPSMLNIHLQGSADANDGSCDPYFRSTIHTITKLNDHGREYLLGEPDNRQKGVKVLERVRNDLDCLFFHLRENPCLCALPVSRALTAGVKPTKEDLSSTRDEHDGRPADASGDLMVADFDVVRASGEHYFI
jgi:hypothetical protein